MKLYIFTDLTHQKVSPINDMRNKGHRITLDIFLKLKKDQSGERTHTYIYIAEFKKSVRQIRTKYDFLWTFKEYVNPLGMGEGATKKMTKCDIGGTSMSQRVMSLLRKILFQQSHYNNFKSCNNTTSSTF